MPTETEREPGLVVVAVREWWNPAGHFVVSARAFDTETGRVAVVFPDGHGNEAVRHAVQMALEIPAARVVFDVVRVARRRDLHTDPARAGLDRVSVVRGTVTA